MPLLTRLLRLRPQREAAPSTARQRCSRERRYAARPPHGQGIIFFGSVVGAVMAHVLPEIRPISIEAIEAARERIKGTVIRSPLIRLDHGVPKPEIYLKLENLQPTNSFKLRGAANAVAMLPADRRAEGVWTISAGNAGQGVAYAARQARVPCTVVAIETAPTAKLERMRALGAKLVLVSYEGAWNALDDRAYPGVEGTFIHPFDDDDFIAGHATMGLEILED